MIRLELTTRNGKGELLFERVGGSYPTREAALAAAKTFAGLGATYHRNGMRVGYWGPNGKVHLNVTLDDYLAAMQKTRGKILL